MTVQRSGPVVWLAIVAATCVSLFLLQRVLWLVVPFLLGMIFYYMLLPPLHRLVLTGLNRDMAAMIVGGVFFVLLVTGIVLLLSWTVSNVDSWQTLFGHYLEGGLRLARNTARMLEQRSNLLERVHLSDTVDTQFAAYTENFAQTHLAGFVVSIGAWLPSLLLAPFLTYFFLRDGRRFKRFLARAVPNAFFERTLYLLHEVDQTARRYFQGLIQLTLIDTAMLAFGLWIIGVSSPLVLGAIAAVLAWVPILGSIVGCVLVVLVASTDAPTQPLVAYSAIGVFVAVRLLDDFIFMPATLGRSLRLHPLVTVLMIFIGGSVAGVAGLMLVLPLMGVVMVIGKTLGKLMTNPRLRARHRNAQALRAKDASSDLADPRTRRNPQ
jgi:predicted PurR-regulated permease PerM